MKKYLSILIPALTISGLTPLYSTPLRTRTKIAIGATLAGAATLLGLELAGPYTEYKTKRLDPSAENYIIEGESEKDRAARIAEWQTYVETRRKKLKKARSLINRIRKYVTIGTIISGCAAAQTYMTDLQKNAPRTLSTGEIATQTTAEKTEQTSSTETGTTENHATNNIIFNCGGQTTVEIGIRVKSTSASASGVTVTPIPEADEATAEERGIPDLSR